MRVKIRAVRFTDSLPLGPMSFDRTGAPETSKQGHDPPV
jgi:hypothetical protein